jgi:hypothetical protein
MDGVAEPRFYEDSPDKRGWFFSLFRFIQRRTKAVSKTSAYTVEADVWTVFVDASGGAVTITLPTASTWGGREIRVMKTDNSVNAVTVAPMGSDTASTTSLASQYSKASYVSNGESLWGAF